MERHATYSSDLSPGQHELGLRQRPRLAGGHWLASLLRLTLEAEHSAEVRGRWQSQAKGTGQAVNLSRARFTQVRGSKFKKSVWREKSIITERSTILFAF